MVPMLMTAEAIIFNVWAKLVMTARVPKTVIRTGTTSVPIGPSMTLLRHIEEKQNAQALRVAGTCIRTTTCHMMLNAKTKPAHHAQQILNVNRWALDVPNGGITKIPLEYNVYPRKTARQATAHSLVKIILSHAKVIEGMTARS